MRRGLEDAYRNSALCDEAPSERGGVPTRENQILIRKGSRE